MRVQYFKCVQNFCSIINKSNFPSNIFVRSNKA